MARYTKAERAEAIAELRKLLPPGSTVYTIVTHVARSGMSRNIKLYCLEMTDGKPGLRWISNYAARAIDYPQANRDGALKVGGCGMDMCWHVVSSLAYALYGHEPDRAKWQGSAGSVLRKEDL